MKYNITKQRRKRRISGDIQGTNVRPRISVFRSNKYIYAQAIDDVGRHTIASVSSLKIAKKDKLKKGDAAKTVGLELGKILAGKKIKQAVFDRGIYAYLGRVQKLCDGIREAGVKI